MNELYPDANFDTTYSKNRCPVCSCTFTYLSSSILVTKCGSLFFFHQPFMVKGSGANGLANFHTAFVFILITGMTNQKTRCSYWHIYRVRFSRSNTRNDVLKDFLFSPNRIKDSASNCTTFHILICTNFWGKFKLNSFGDRVWRRDEGNNPHGRWVRYASYWNTNQWIRLGWCWHR